MVSSTVSPRFQNYRPQPPGNHILPPPPLIPPPGEPPGPSQPLPANDPPLYAERFLRGRGSAGDGIVRDVAEANEFRTAPLWGWRGTAPCPHHGRAGNLDAAIRAHDGEGKVARDRYAALTPIQRAEWLEFLNSL
jgi:hypothetical protein